MLIKARPACGDTDTARELLDLVQPLIYSTTLDFGAVEAVSMTRERISDKLAARKSQDGLDIKLAPGGIRDIEFLVQCLQRLHGGASPVGSPRRHAAGAGAFERQGSACPHRNTPG